MSKNVLSLLIVVCALFAGACAGRQIRTGMPGPSSFQALNSQARPVDAAVHAEVLAPAVKVEEIPAAPAVQLTDAELRLKVQQEIDTYVHGLIDEVNADNRAAAERMHGPYFPPTLPDNDELVAALRIDYESFRRMSAEADRQFYASVKDIVDQAYAREREDRQQLAVARTERRRASAQARLTAAAVPAAAPQTETLLAAVAAPEPVPPVMPQVAASVATPSTTTAMTVPTPLSLFIPDPATVAKSDEYLSINLIGAGFAAVLGILLGIVLARRRPREIDDPLHAESDEFKDVPDGTLLVREIQGGKVSSTYRLMADLQLRKSHPTSASADDAEQHWFDTTSPDAAIVANVEADDGPVPTPTAAQPDPIAASVAIEPSPPVEALAPQDPLPEPPPVFAAGTRDISSQGRENHSVDGEIHVTPKDEERVVDKPAHSIIYEERSDAPPQDTTAPSN